MPGRAALFVMHDLERPSDLMRLLTTPIHRNRPIYGVAIALVIGAGLLWRSNWLPLSSSVAKYGGDALWALMVFLGFGILFCRASTARIAWGAIGFAWCIEFLQLYHAPWIDSIRATQLGRLVLGSSFNAPDLMAYVVGIAVGACVEWLVFVRTSNSLDPVE